MVTCVLATGSPDAGKRGVITQSVGGAYQGERREGGILDGV